MTNEEYIQKSRVLLADFLLDAVVGVEKILDADPTKGFYFPKYTKRTDYNQRCMGGWLPEVFPDFIIREGERIRARHKPNTVFMPGHVGLPMPFRVWQALTVTNAQDLIGFPILPRQATFKQTKDMWLTVSSKYRSGLMDDYIMSEQELNKLLNL